MPELVESGLRKVAQVARAIRKLPLEGTGAFVSITNAIDLHLGKFPPDLQTSRLVAEAGEAFVKPPRIDP